MRHAVSLLRYRLGDQRGLGSVGLIILVGNGGTVRTLTTIQPTGEPTRWVHERVEMGPNRITEGAVHRLLSSGRIAFNAARMADPLLISAVTRAEISPPGSARPSATVFIAATIT
jgi:hypothetical protein